MKNLLLLIIPFVLFCNSGCLTYMTLHDAKEKIEVPAIKTFKTGYIDNDNNLIINYKLKSKYSLKIEHHYIVLSLDSIVNTKEGK